MGIQFSDTEMPKYKDEFIVKHSQKYKNNKMTDIKSFDHRRAVFISLIGLYQSWKDIPMIVLYSSIFLLPIKENWLLHPNRYRMEIKHSFLAKLTLFHRDTKETQKFLQLLKWKHSQGLLFCTLDDYGHFAFNTYDHHEENKLINPFWTYFSQRLTSLYDPVTDERYKPIITDVEYWQDIGNKSIFGANHSEILCELYLLTMKYHTLQEIIHQSNPQSLNPIITYNDACFCKPEQVITIQASPPSQPLLSGFIILSDYDDNDEQTDNEDEIEIIP